MTNFLNLPSELRQHIYSLALPAQHLKVQGISDPACDLGAEKLAGIPSLFFVNKAVSEEAAASFYSRAVLNISPLRPPSYLLDSLNGNGPKLNLAFGLDIEFASYPRRHLKRITKARIFSAQRDAINAEAYEALLRWLVDNTVVQTIHLSVRLMTRIRSARTDINTTYNLRAAAPSLTLLRTTYVYGHPARSTWELMRMREIKQVLYGVDLPELQSYVLEEGGQHDALLDPRWDLRRNNNDERTRMMHNISLGWMPC